MLTKEEPLRTVWLARALAILWLGIVGLTYALALNEGEWPSGHPWPGTAVMLLLLPQRRWTRGTLTACAGVLAVGNLWLESEALQAPRSAIEERVALAD